MEQVSVVFDELAEAREDFLVEFCQLLQRFDHLILVLGHLEHLRLLFEQLVIGQVERGQRRILLDDA